jgi:type VI secretion system lysozyme-like protein
MRTDQDLIFDRFIFPESGKRLEEGVIAFDEVASVIREVTMLLNTRSPLPATAFLRAKRRTVLSYGLPDFIHFSPRSRVDAQLLAKQIRESVSAYEPRLRVDLVTVEAPRPCRDLITAVISGVVHRRDKSQVGVTFPVQVGLST